MIGLAFMAAGPALAFDPDVVVAGDHLVLRLPQNASLSGEYVVDEKGRIALVSIGRLEVGGRTIEAAEDLLKAAINDGLGLDTASLLVDFAARPPVVVVGDVEASGPVVYRSGLVVIEAIALAGGFARPDPQDTTIRLEHSRIEERIGTLHLGLAEILVTTARLEAEEAGTASFEPPAEASDHAAPDAISRMVRDQRALMERRRTALDDRRRALQKEAVAATEEAEALDRQLAAKERQIVLLRQEIDQLSGAREGVIAGTRFLDLDRRVAEVQGDIAELTGRIARTRRDRIELDRLATALDQEFRTEVRQAANDARSTRASLERQLDGATRQLGVADVLGALVGPRERGDAPSGLSIMRRAGEDFLTVRATLTTPLRPGDILRVPLSTNPAPTADEERPSEGT